MRDKRESMCKNKLIDEELINIKDGNSFHLFDITDTILL